MTTLRILSPEATTNYIENPSFRYDTVGWTAVGSSIERVLTYARFGISSLKISTNGAALYEGVYYRVNDLAGISDVITVSAYVRGKGEIRIRLYDSPSGNEFKSKKISLRDDIWQRIEVSGRCSGSNDVRLYIETAGVSADSTDIYLDAAQMEVKAYSTSYCDGDQPGCRWNGLFSASTSSRSAYTREGGRWITVSGEEREADDLYMTFMIGAGVAPVDLNRQSYALSPGSYLDNIKVKERPMGLIFHTKHQTRPRTARQARSMSNLHELRQMLIDIIKPDKTAGNEPFWLEYTDGSTPLYIKCYYDGGLEGDWDIRNSFIMNFQVRLLSVYPFFVEGDLDSYLTDISDTRYFKGVAGRINGEWSDLNGGFWDTNKWNIDGLVRRFALGPKGEVYACGCFNIINARADAINPNEPGNGVAKWDGEKWITLGAPNITPANAVVYAAAVAPNGDLYVGGDFTNIGGVAAAKIAYWDVSASTWNALGAGVLNGNVLALAIAPNGDVYAGGTFDTAGGVSRWSIARWDGSSWQTVGAHAGLDNGTGAQGGVYDMAITKDGSTVYIVGDIDDERTQPGTFTDARYRCKYDVATNAFSIWGSGDIDNAAFRVKISPSGEVYMGGGFQSIGIQTINSITKWNGSMFVTLGDNEYKEDIRDIHFDESGNIAAVWNDYQGDEDPDNSDFGYFNGSKWLDYDLKFKPDTAASIKFLFACIFDNNGDLFIGGRGLGFATADSVNNLDSYHSAITYITNDGSAEVRPLVYIKGKGHLRYIENQSTNQRVWFDLDINVDEEIFIDFGKGQFYSTVRGDLFYALEPGSDFHAFVLVPGINKIAAFIADDVNCEMYVYYTPTHWSGDATENEESL